MDQTNYFIDWIHRVEWHCGRGKGDGEFKRLKGIVLELCFERGLSTLPELGFTDEVSYGWCYKSVGHKDVNAVRHWFVLSQDYSDPDFVHPVSDRKRQINKQFMESLLRQNSEHRIFVISFKSDLHDVHQIPEFVWKCQEVEFSSDKSVVLKKQQSLAMKYQSQISEKVELSLKSVGDQPERIKIDTWLRKLSLHDLRRLFATRCFMNFSGLYLSDIDGLMFDQNGTLKMIEFKRKDPAKGDFYLPRDKHLQESWLACCIRAVQKLKYLKSLTEIVKFFARTDLFILEPNKLGVFGLDESHYKNISLCSALDMRYQYLVWNSRESDPGKLVNLQFMPTGHPVLLSKYVTENDFSGITKTNPGDSGTYAKKPRFQLVIRADSFTVMGIESVETSKKSTSAVEQPVLKIEGHAHEG